MITKKYRFVNKKTPISENKVRQLKIIKITTKTY